MQQYPRSFFPDTKVTAALNSLYGERMHRGSDGQMHKIDATTRIASLQGETIAAAIDEYNCRRTLETGFAYGFSTLFILGAIKRFEDSTHTAIDPYEKKLWHGIGLEKVKDVGMADRFTWICEDSFCAFGQLAMAGARYDFIYVDADHKFDSIVIDLHGSDRVLEIGGILAFDDLWMPSTQAAINFFEKNLTHYRRLPSAHKNLALYQKTALDSRPWWHYTPFSTPTDEGRWP
jgi:predicted O-methyltransferase YrrM